MSESKSRGVNGSEVDHQNPTNEDVGIKLFRVTSCHCPLQSPMNEVIVSSITVCQLNARVGKPESIQTGVYHGTQMLLAFSDIAEQGNGEQGAKDGLEKLREHGYEICRYRKCTSKGDAVADIILVLRGVLSNKDAIAASCDGLDGTIKDAYLAPFVDIITPKFRERRAQIPA